eukprot:gnl/MRDRNA2_/MRDRNA2_85106_c0_seq1.p1 gnl/MRDRNA2_/MRDRNA2_85106_c0~~gnl/MRDRNA2_/MRDRNA2_85106_c0_seq1.p1  ORF type:complete len:485 (-),score=79.68 gnl/MRDRNA2_/MRDRNA2_85106_c0_seq1:108-1562(-)
MGMCNAKIDEISACKATMCACNFTTTGGRSSGHLMVNAMPCDSTDMRQDSPNKAGRESGDFTLNAMPCSSTAMRQDCPMDPCICSPRASREVPDLVVAISLGKIINRDLDHFFNTVDNDDNSNLDRSKLRKLLTDVKTRATKMSIAQKEEFMTTVARHISISESVIDHAFQSADKDGSCSIDLEELMAFIADLSVHLEEESGAVFAASCGESAVRYTREQVAEILGMTDILLESACNTDIQLTKAEFRRIMKKVLVKLYKQMVEDVGENKVDDIYEPSRTRSSFSESTTRRNTDVIHASLRRASTSYVSESGGVHPCLTGAEHETPSLRSSSTSYNTELAGSNVSPRKSSTSSKKNDVEPTLRKSKSTLRRTKTSLDADKAKPGRNTDDTEKFNASQKKQDATDSPSTNKLQDQANEEDDGMTAWEKAFLEQARQRAKDKAAQRAKRDAERRSAASSPSSAASSPFSKQKNGLFELHPDLEHMI